MGRELKQKILILGSNGMLGKELMEVFSGCDRTGWDIDDIDITDKSQVEKKITGLKPDIIINAAAYTDVDRCETDWETCMKVNGEAVGYIAGAAGKAGATVVHISTDYVFDGKKCDGYREDAAPDPINNYGKAKLLGERRLAANRGKYYLIRTSWLFGRYGKNFVETILKLAREREEIEVVDDQKGSPTYALDLSGRIREIVTGNYAPGIYHVTNRGTCTWFEFAKEIVFQSKLKCRVIPTTSDTLQRPAPRPRYSILLNTKFKKELRSWQEALQHYLSIIRV